jgi:transposase
MKPITKENRELIVAAKERGEEAEVIATWFNVSLASVYNVLALHKKTGSVTPKPYMGRPCRLDKCDLEKIREKIQEQNDITLEELIDKLDLPIKKSRLSEIVIEMDLPFKKRRSMRTDSCEKTCRKNEKITKNIKKI